MSNSILIHATGYRKFTTENEVFDAWAKNVDFRTPFERTSYMRRTDFEQFGNQMDGIIFNDQGLHVIIKSAII